MTKVTSSLRIEEDLKNKMKLHCKERNTYISDFIVDAITKQLPKQNEKETQSKKM